jgi:hypothetical protein
MNVRTTALCALVLLVSACGANHNRANVSPAPMPTGGSFTGVWFSPQYGEMNMVQTGEQVICEYTKDERRGRIEGTAQGNLMRFQWTERRELVSGVPQTNRGRGYFQLLHDNEGFKIVGAWGIDDNEIGGGPWNAIRSPRRQPHLSTDGGHSEGGSSNGNGSTYDTSSAPSNPPPPTNGGGGGEDDLQGL